MNLFLTKSKYKKRILFVLILLVTKYFLPAKKIENLKNIKPLAILDTFPPARYLHNNRQTIIQAFS